MKLFLVENDYASYRLQKYVVVAKDHESALRQAGDKLKEYSIAHKYTVNTSLFHELGINPKLITEYIDTPDYYSHFKIKMLLDDIEEQTIASVLI